MAMVIGYIVERLGNCPYTSSTCQCRPQDVIGHLEVSFVPLDMSYGHLEVSYGHLEVAYAHLEVSSGPLEAS